MAERDHVNVRVYVKRELWAPVKALATEKGLSIDDVLEQILTEYFKVRGN